MTEDISVQILAQTSENIQKLFDLITRVDERVKSIQDKQHEFDSRMEDIIKIQNQLMQKVAVLESRDHSSVAIKLHECEKQLVNIDKRLGAVETASGANSSRWNHVFDFVIKLIWIILAGWVLTKLEIQPPPGF